MLLTVTNLSATESLDVPFPFDRTLAASASLTLGVTEQDFLRHLDDSGNPAWKVWDDLIKRGEMSVTRSGPNGSSLLELLSGGGVRQSIGPFVADGVGGVIAAGQTNDPLRYVFEVAAAVPFVAPRDGFITGLSAWLSATPAADEVTPRVTVNGTEVTPLAACELVNGETVESATFERGLFPFSAGDEIGVSYSSGATGTPALVATVEIES